MIVEMQRLPGDRLPGDCKGRLYIAAAENNGSVGVAPCGCLPSFPDRASHLKRVGRGALLSK